jgi:hypothetical protein
MLVHNLKNVKHSFAFIFGVNLSPMLARCWLFFGREMPTRYSSLQAAFSILLAILAISKT